MATTLTQPEPVQTGLFTAQGQPVPLRGVTFTGRLCGLAMELRVAQRYRNEEAKPIECTYLFPLPEEAAVHALTVTLGNRTIRAGIEEREKAFELYDEALAKGNSALLLDQERPNVYQLSVGNLGPGAEALVEITLVYEARRDAQGVRLMIPCTISPRYTPPRLSPEVLAEIERTTPPYAAAVPYGLTVGIEAELSAPARSVASPSHPIQVSMNGPRASVTLAQRETLMDRDFVLQFELDAPGPAGAVVAEAHGRDHLLLELFPDLPTPEPAAPRDLVFLVDCSGSMSGDSISEARRAVELCLRQLRPGDRFRIVRFGSRTDVLGTGSQTLDQQSLEAAVDMVRRMDADLGGTEILPAMETILRFDMPGRMDLLLLTDGQVSNEEEVLALAAKNQARWRVFTFGIGAGSSEFLVRGLARNTGGQCEFIFPGERIEPKVLRQFGRMEAPVMETIQLDLGGLAVEVVPASLPALGQGDTLLVAARLSPGCRLADGAAVRLTGQTAGGPVSFTAVARRADAGGPVPLLWARRRIRELEEGSGVPAGSRQQRGQKRQPHELIALSKEYGLLCSETSLVAVMERAPGEKITTPAELRPVPVLVTTGWHGRGRMMAPMAPPRMMGPSAPLMMHCISESFSSSPQGRKKVSSRRMDSFGQIRASTGAGACPAPPPPWYLELLLRQEARGSFPLDETLAGFSGLTLDTLRDAAAKIVPAGSETPSILATVLALLLLETRAADHEPEWRLAARKARNWLRAHPAAIEGRDAGDWLKARIP